MQARAENTLYYINSSDLVFRTRKIEKKQTPSKTAKLIMLEAIFMDCNGPSTQL
jgi:hypothetical protein